MTVHKWKKCSKNIRKQGQKNNLKKTIYKSQKIYYKDNIMCLEKTQKKLLDEKVRELFKEEILL